jgi:hypothetical protein
MTPGIGSRAAVLRRRERRRPASGASYRTSSLRERRRSRRVQSAIFATRSVAIECGTVDRVFDVEYSAFAAAAPCEHVTTPCGPDH